MRAKLRIESLKSESTEKRIEKEEITLKNVIIQSLKEQIKRVETENQIFQSFVLFFILSHVIFLQKL